MCGLVGIVNTSGVYPVDFDKAFKNLLLIDQLRGDHSTGLLSVTSSKKAEVIKKAVNATEFLDVQGVTRAVAQSNKLLMGHNRFATKGRVDDASAHPFTHGHVTLAHNGTLTSHHHLTKEHYTVDSEAIAAAMSATSSREEEIAVLESLPGAYALTWYNHDTNEFHIARNSERKLFICEVVPKDISTHKVDEKGFNGTWIYASEPGMIYLAAARNGISVREAKLIPEGEMWTFKLNEYRLKSMEVDTFTPKKPEPIKTYYNSAAWDYSDYGTSTSTKNKGNSSNERYASPLIGRFINASFAFFEPYSSASPYGCLWGEWAGEVICLGGIKGEDEALQLLEESSIYLKIVSKDVAEGYFNVIRQDTNKSSTNIVPFKGVDLDKPDNVNKITSVVKCESCNANIFPGDRRFVYLNSNYCSECEAVVKSVFELEND